MIPSTPPITYSVVIPLKDEEENLLALVEELEPVMESLHTPWELICIDDGSQDQTLPLLQKLAQEKPYLRVLVFAKNSGQSSAFDAGFKAACGQYVITLDGDRQNDPRDIPSLLSLMDHADLVVGWRKERRDPWVKRLSSKIANAIRRRVCHDGVLDTGCSLKVYRTSCLRHLKMYKGMHRFLPALFQIEGFRVTQLPVRHRERTHGVTKYSFSSRLIAPLLDMLVVAWMRRRHLGYTIAREFDHDHS